MMSNTKENSLRQIKLTSPKLIGDGYPCFLIAEIGQNHQGDIKIAQNLIKAAKESGADCVKFQKSDLSEKFTSGALELPYLGQHSWGKTYGEHKQYLEFSYDEYRVLQKYAEEEVGIMFSATAMDQKSLEFLCELNVPFIKIGSGDVNNYPLIELAARKNLPLIISTGMETMDGIKQIYDLVKPLNKNFCLLHCVSAYPAPVEEINLKVIQLYQNQFPDVLIGYSGHELGTDISLAAVAMGAKVIERHLTLDRSQKGSDHICSLTPDEFKLMAERIRIVEKAMGKAVKILQPSEQDCFVKLRKSVVMAETRKAGHVIQRDDVKVKVAYPMGIGGEFLNKIIGATLMEEIECDESIKKHHIGSLNVE